MWAMTVLVGHSGNFEGYLLSIAVALRIHVIRIISDGFNLMFSPLQFYFTFILGYELKIVFCSSRNCQRISCTQAAERMRIKLQGPVEHSPKKQKQISLLIQIMKIYMKGEVE